MPIDTVHPEYSCRSSEWLDCRNAFNGQRAVKDAAERYLPKLKGQQDDEYKAYKGRALFYSITSKTISALVGMALGKVPEIKHSPKMDPYFIDNSGVQFNEALTNTIQEVLLMGRYGALVDRPEGGGMPYVTFYLTEDIINWNVRDDGVLDMIVLRERYFERDAEDRYLRCERTRYRELYLNDRGKVEVVLHTPADKEGKTFTAGVPTSITNTGVPLDFIPFFAVNPVGVGICPIKSPVLDIVDINLSHYRTSADLEHGRHFTGLPTPYIIGGQSEGGMAIGSTRAWIIPDPSAKVGYLEFTGQGLQSLEKAMSEKQAQLASLSARLIDNSSRGSEAADTVKLRYLSETASLATVVLAAEAFLSLVYNAIAKMEGLEPVTIQLNKHFLDGKMSAQELTAWVGAYLQGGISKEMLLYNLKRGDALPPPGTDQGEIPDRPAPTAQPGNTPTNQK